MMASLACRNVCACARASSLVIHPPLAAAAPIAVGPSDTCAGGAIFPSSVMPAFSVTKGM